MSPQRREQYDAIVVGSGITGGWAAKELTEHGLRTLIIERGRHVEHGGSHVEVGCVGVAGVAVAVANPETGAEVSSAADLTLESPDAVAQFLTEGLKSF